MMMFLWLPFLFLIPLAVFWMVRPGVFGGCSTHPAAYTPTGQREDPLDLARVRLARGEITVQQYEEIQRVLRG